MSDLEFIQRYLEEPAADEQEEKGESFNPLSTLSAPQAAALSTQPVKINIPEKAEEKINEAKGQKAGKSLLGKASAAKKQSERVLGAAVPDIGELPKPPSSGVGLLLFLALLTVFAITPAGDTGQSRLSLLWQTILGNYVYASGGGKSSDKKTGGNPRNPSGQPAPNPLPPDPLDPWGIQGGYT